MVLSRLRGRLPVVVFVLLVLVCLALIGFACACLGDTPLHVLERALAAAPSLAAVVELWPLMVLSLVAASSLLVVTRPARPPNRASPALLQRFLF